MMILCLRTYEKQHDENKYNVVGENGLEATRTSLKITSESRCLSLWAATLRCMLGNHDIGVIPLGMTKPALHRLALPPPPKKMVESNPFLL